MNTGDLPVGGGAVNGPGADEGRARLSELAADYELVRELGRGGTAVVYHAVERALARDVAIKVVHAAHASDAEAVARLAREARLVAQLRHPNIVTLFGTRQLRDGSIALIMQYVPGRTLKDAIRADGPLPVALVERVLREMALALQHAHQRQGLVHRDLKPENIYLDDEGGRALLSDFGIARATDLDSSLTLVGTALGTPAYMSPEQIDGLPLDGRSDLYSLGLVAHEMLTGKQPWAGNNLYSIIYRQKHEDLPPLAEFRRDVPPYLERAIAGLLHKDRERRWTDASRLLAALQPTTGLDAVLPPAVTLRQQTGSRNADPAIDDDAPTILFRPDVAGDATRDDSRDIEREVRDAESAPERAAPVDTASTEESAAAATTVATPTANAPTEPELPAIVPPAPAARVPSNSAPPAIRFFLEEDPIDAESGAHAPNGDASATVMSIAASSVVVPADAHANERRVAPRGAAAPARKGSASGRRRVPVLVGVALFITLAGAMAPFIRADGERVEDLPAAPSSDAAPLAPVPAGPPGAPARLEVLTEDLTGYVGRVLPVPVGLVVEDAAGRAVAGVSVALEVVSGAGSVSPATAVSDSMGLVMARWTLGEEPGANELRVRTADGSGAVTVIRARGVAGPVARLVAERGVDQTAARGTMLDDSIVFRLEDAAGNPVVGQRVRFDVRAGGGTVRPAEVASDSTGRVRAAWTIGSAQESNTLRATTASGLSVDVEARGEFRLTPQPRIIAGGTHTCALGGTGSIECWGGNDTGQLGAGAAAPRSGAEVPRTQLPYARLAAGVSHTCALDRDGAALCWGANDSGQLGTGDRAARSTPAPLRAGTRFTTVTAGLQHTCALVADGTAFCWGEGAAGQLGDGNNVSRSAPSRVAGGHELGRIEAGWRHTCAVNTSNRALCWGNNADGQLGDGTTTSRNVPVVVTGDVRFVDIAAGAAHTCGVTIDGSAYCWGHNDGGQLGVGTRTASSQPLRVQTGVPLVSLVAGAVHTCGLARTGHAYCWGRNNFGQLGNDGTQDALLPVAVSGNLRFTSLSASGSHTCGRSVSGESYCWGYNVEGQLGDATRANRTRPERVSVAR